MVPVHYRSPPLHNSQKAKSRKRKRELETRLGTKIARVEQTPKALWNDCLGH